MGPQSGEDRDKLQLSSHSLELPTSPCSWHLSGAGCLGGFCLKREAVEQPPDVTAREFSTGSSTAGLPGSFPGSCLLQAFLPSQILHPTFLEGRVLVQSVSPPFHWDP